MTPLRSREPLVFVFFLLVSGVFWLLQTLDEELEMSLDVRLELTGVPADVIITTPLPQSVIATVRDKGTQLFHYWRHGTAPLSFTFAECADGERLGHVRLQTQDVAQKVVSVLVPTSRVTAVTPDTLEFWFTRGLHRLVPVQVQDRAEAADEYCITGMQARPSEVEVYAPQSVLDTLTVVRTCAVDTKGVDRSTTVTVPLEPVKGVKFAAQSVDVDISVDLYVEKELTVPVRFVNFPAGRSLRVFPQEVTVTFTTGYELSRTIGPDDFAVVFTWEQILRWQGEGRERLPVSLRAKPEGISAVSIEPSELDYLIEDKPAEE